MLVRCILSVIQTYSLTNYRRHRIGPATAFVRLVMDRSINKSATKDFHNRLIGLDRPRFDCGRLRLGWTAFLPK